MEFRVLGPLEVVVDGQTVAIASRRQRALLALLIVHANRVVGTDRLLDDLWGDEAPASGRDAVVFHVSRLRRSLGDNGVRIETRDGGYALRADPDEIDAGLFEQLVAEGHGHLGDDPAAAVQRLSDALRLWRGEPFEGLADFAFTAEEIRRLEQLRLRAIEDRFEAQLTLGHHAAVVADLDRFVDREPLRERARATLMLALYRAGRQADALRVMHDGRRILAEELGIDPSPELTALEGAILRQDPTLLAGPLPVLTTFGALGDTPAGRRPVRNPYKGLRPFGEEDAADFFGREALTARLVERLGEVARTTGLLAVVGPSGSGKSSVVRAGLIRAIRAGALPGSEDWVIAALYPGQRPVDELTAALRSAVLRSAALRAAATTVAIAAPSAAEIVADPTALAAAVEHLIPAGSRLVVVVDQLEELWSIAPAEERDRFLGAITRGLTGAAGRLVVVTTLRADHLDEALRTPALGRFLRDGTELVPALRREEIERAIEGPAAGVGLAIDPGLVDRIVADVADRPAMLPLFQFSLTELTERTETGRLDRSGYDAIGGVIGALAGRAEATFEALEPAEREAARQVFLRLVAVEAGGVAGCRRVPRNPDDENATESAVIERFGRARMLAHGRDARSGEPTVEIAHEALLTRWPRLRAWVEGEREAIWMRRRLGEATDEWLEHGRDEGFLLAGSRLEMFASWATTTDLRLGAEEMAFLDASLAERRRTEEVEALRRAEERRLERRGTRWLMALVAVFAVAAVVAMVLFGLIWQQAETAAEERAIARAHELAVAANGRLDTDAQLALLLALESARATADRGWITEDTMDALHWAIQAAQVPYPTDEGPVAVRRSPEGARGVFLLPAAELVRLAQHGARWRSFSQDECRTYLRLQSCPGGIQTGPASYDGLAVLTDAGPVPADRLAGPGTEGSVVAVWSQLPVDPIAMLAPFTAVNRTTVIVSSGGPAADPTRGAAQADIAILARPDDVARLSRSQLLLDLRTILRPEELDTLDTAPLADLGWVGRFGFGADAEQARRVGIPIAVSASSLIWYPARAFTEAGYEPPTSWAELDELARRMVADGRTPWCMGLADGAAAADWAEDLALASLGPAAGPSPAVDWLDLGGAAMAHALLDLHHLVWAGNSVVDGPEAAIRMTAGEAAARMGDGPDPRCWLVHASAAERADWEGILRDDLQAVRLPLGQASTTMRGTIYTLVVVRDRPEVRMLVRELLGPAAAASLAQSGPPSALLPLGPSGQAAWPAGAGTIQADLAAAISGGFFWSDASDQLPRELGATALPEAVLRVVEALPGTEGTVVASELDRLVELNPPPTR